MTNDRNYFAQADAIIYKDRDYILRKQRPPNQIWIVYYLESPAHTRKSKIKNVFNWTATYRRDSDIVTPYLKWIYYDENVKFKRQNKNYAKGRTKKVAWFVSNCRNTNKRQSYAKELSKYIQVDVYGKCGKLKCLKQNQKECMKILKDNYKFYLAFENSNCIDYISEKIIENAFRNNILPITLGARMEDYDKVVPEGSYLHVDNFTSPKDLAKFLKKLDRNDTLYNSYFRWKGTGEFMNTHFWCRLCALLHGPIRRKTYEDINLWWSWQNYGLNGNRSTCEKNGWKKINKTSAENVKMY